MSVKKNLYYIWVVNKKEYAFFTYQNEKFSGTKNHIETKAFYVIGYNSFKKNNIPNKEYKNEKLSTSILHLSQ